MAVISAPAFGQTAGRPEIGAKAVLPAVPYWWTASEAVPIDLTPLLWFNEIDGGKGPDSACCVIGIAGRHRLSRVTLWWGLGFGLEANGGTPAAIEAAIQHSSGGILSFRSLHGRVGFTALYPALRRPSGARVSVGVSGVWVADARYLQTVPLFDCPTNAPASLCVSVDAPYGWSAGRDYALEAEGTHGTGDWDRPWLRAGLSIGVKAAGGDHSYARIEAESRVGGDVGPARWKARFAGGWSSEGAPQQRRFRLEGAGSIRRWLNPYLDARGALFEDQPYFVEGGPHLRAYTETKPLVFSYVAASGELSREGRTEAGLWGRIGLFLEAAWTPAVPGVVGPEELNEEGDLLFDWRELPEGEDEARGRFRARVLEVPKVWADGGLSFTGGYDRVALTLSFPLWASESAFADEPFSGERKPFALRWSFNITFFPMGRAGP